MFVIKRYLCLIMILVLVLSPISVYGEEALEIDNNLVNVRLLENGDLVIIEDITYRLDDDSNGIIRDIDLREIDSIKDVSVAELVDGREIEYVLDPDAENGDSNAYNYYMEYDYFNIKLFSPSEDEVKTFRFRYTIANAAVRHRDIGELYYKFLGESNQTPIKNFTALIQLPNFNREDIKTFAHGPLNGRIHFTDNDLIRLDVENVPTKTFIEARILFPLDYIPLSMNIGNSSLNEILNEEEQFARNLEEELIRRENMKDLLNRISFALTVFAGAILLLIYRFTRRDPYILGHLEDAPLDKLSPAELDYFMDSIISPRGIMATIFDLARKEYIEIDEVSDENMDMDDREFILINNKKMNKDLLDHEKLFMDWIFNEIGNGDIVSTEDIENSRKKISSFNKYHGKWIKQVRKDVEARDYFDNRTKRFGLIVALLSIPVFILAVIAIVNQSLYGVGALILSMILFIAGIALNTRKSDKGYIQYKAWKDIEKELEKHAPVNINIPRDKTMIYAYTLGLSMDRLDDYRRNYGNDYFPLYWGSWYFINRNKSGGSLVEDKFSKGFYGNYGSSTPSSTGFGGGGGFTGGGGGGIGGGGSRGF